MLTQDELNNLISCSKLVENAEPSRGMNTEKRSYRKNLDLKATQERHLFRVFIRQSTELLEDFSIGLTYRSGDKEKGNIILIRFNGNHGDVDWSKDGHYSSFHIHRMTEDLLEQGIREPKETEITTRYSTLEEALAEFFNEINLENWLGYFPELRQLPLIATVGGQE